MINNLNILSLNCRSIHSKISEIKLLIYTKKPHVVCLCETWTSPGKEYSFINYSAIWSHRTASRGGGLAILIRSDIISFTKTLVHLNNPLEVQAVSIKMQNTELDIMNLYNPNQNIDINTFKHYFSQLSGNFVIVGDLNAHHSLWSQKGTQNNTTGRAIARIIMDTQNLCLATIPEMPTYVNAHNGNVSTLDLHLVSANLLPAQSITTCGCVGSDHCPLIMTICKQPSIQKIKYLPKWKLNDVNWDTWVHGLRNIEWNPEMTLDESNLFLVNHITTSRNQPPWSTGEYNPKYSKPWWNSECARLVAIRRRAKNKVKRNCTALTLSELRKAENDAKSAIKKSKG